MEFNVNAQRIDPYKNFKFRVVATGADGGPLTIAGVSKVSGLKRTTEVVSHRHGGDLSTDRKSPGRSSFEPITLERGITHDETFAAWALAGIHSFSTDADVHVREGDCAPA